MKKRLNRQLKKGKRAPRWTMYHAALEKLRRAGRELTASVDPGFAIEAPRMLDKALSKVIARCKDDRLFVQEEVCVKDSSGS